jgi:RNA polymerase sigma-70 factor, ECF subfamily
MRHPEESALVEGVKNGDQELVEELIRVYGPQVFSLALRYLKNREDAEEVSQDVLLKVVTRMDAFRGDAALSSWIYRITFNTAMSRLRGARGSRHLRAPDQPSGSKEGFRAQKGPAGEPADWSSLGDEHVLRTELRGTLAEAIRALPAIYRAPVILRDIRGLSAEEASAVLRVKDQTLKSRLHRGRVILREKLPEFAGGLSLRPALQM